MRQKQILYIKRIYRLTLKIGSRHARQRMPEIGYDFRDVVNVISQRHTPPEVDVLNMQVEAVAAQSNCLTYIQSHCGMTDRQQISIVSDLAQLSGRSSCNSKAANSAFILAVAGVEIEHSRIRKLFNCFLRNSHSVWQRYIIRVMAYQPWRAYLMQHAIQREC